MTAYRHPHRCLFCNGEGRLHGYHHDWTGEKFSVSWPCRHCDGTGIVYAASDRQPEEQVHADT